MALINNSINNITSVAEGESIHQSDPSFNTDRTYDKNQYQIDHLNQLMRLPSDAPRPDLTQLKDHYGRPAINFTQPNLPVDQNKMRSPATHCRFQKLFISRHAEKTKQTAHHSNDLLSSEGWYRANAYSAFLTLDPYFIDNPITMVAAVRSFPDSKYGYRPLETSLPWSMLQNLTVQAPYFKDEVTEWVNYLIEQPHENIILFFEHHKIRDVVSTFGIPAEEVIDYPDDAFNLLYEVFVDRTGLTPIMNYKIHAIDLMLNDALYKQTHTSITDSSETISNWPTADEVSLSLPKVSILGQSNPTYLRKANQQQSMRLDPTTFVSGFLGMMTFCVLYKVISKFKITPQQRATYTEIPANDRPYQSKV